MTKKCIFIMGVAGCGKTSVGVQLSAKLGAHFEDADDYHSEGNRDKMAKGIALNDEDRLPWLQRIAELAERSTQRIVIACSALKKNYRKILSASLNDNFVFVYLQVERDELERRLRSRKGHFFDFHLLDSQLDTLEVPHDERNCIIVDANQSLEYIVTDIVSLLTDEQRAKTTERLEGEEEKSRV
ncbi:unnamed protein product [Toxocara canis]|uniref:Gluconokinase n=1 Tax=Toxocara canis TaxID=6265 RepID=A0A183V3K0_TOXCA|nr:unnamed protein product [Toxocara canis]